MARRYLAVCFAWTVVALVGVQSFAQEAELAELKSRPKQDSAAIRSRAEKLSLLDTAALEAELKSLQEMHERNRELWSRLQSIRGLDAAATQAVELRSAKYTLKLWQNQKVYDKETQSLKEAEERAFQQKYNEAFSSRSKHLVDWNNSPEGKAIQNDRAVAERKYRETIKALTEEAAHGNAERVKTLDELQESILDDFQVTANAVNKARELLTEKTKPLEEPAKKEATNTPDPSVTAAKPSPEEFSKQYNLQFKIDYTVDPPDVVETDDYFELTVKVINGKAPFEITMRSSAGDLKRVTLSEPGSRTFPFAFKTVGFPHRIEFTAIDGNGVSKQAVHTVTVHKPHIGTKDPTTGKDKGTQKSPDTNSKTLPTAPSSPTPLLVPMSGTYRAHLWCVGLIPVPPGVGGYTENPNKPVPVSITFNPNGQVEGKCNYTAPYTLFNSLHRSMYSSYEWNIKFTISGSVDWETGIMRLTLPDIRATAYHQNTTVRTDYVDELTASFEGRHTSDPYWEKYLLRMGLIAGQPGMANMDEREQNGFPNFILGPQGKYRFANDGWYGAPGDHPGITAATGTHKVKTITLTAGNVVQSRDVVEGYQRGVANGIAKKTLDWYLKLIGREATPRDLVQMDLVATTIEPSKTITILPNEFAFVEFIGVFSDDFSSPRDLTNVCEWQFPPNVIQVRPGVFRATQPGTYEIRARAKGKSSNWMEGVVTLEVKQNN